MARSEKPCGATHPLPCGLDRVCEVPPEYFTTQLNSAEVWEQYREEVAE